MTNVDGENLERRLAETTDPYTHITLLTEMSEFLGERDAGRATVYANRALDIAQQIGYPAGMLSALLALSWAHYVSSDFVAAVANATEAIKIAREQDLPGFAARALTLLGNNQNILGDPDAALRSYTEASALYEQVGDRRSLSSLLNNVASLYSESSNFLESRRLYQRSLELAQEMNASSSEIATRLVNLARTLIETEQYTEAIPYIREGLSRFEAEGDLIGVAFATSLLGAIARRQKDYESARTFFQRALLASRSATARHEEARTYRQLGELYLDQERPQVALQWLGKALTLFQALAIPRDLYATHELMARAYVQMGDYRAAFQAYEQFHAVKEQLVNEQADNRLRMQQAIYEVQAARLEAEAERQKALRLEQDVEQREQIITDLDNYAEQVAHDLKNPVVIVTGFSEMLLEEPLTDRQRQFAQAIYTAGYKMNQIISGLLSLARARKEEIEPQAVDMEQGLREAQIRLASLLEKFQAQVIVEGRLPMALGHPNWLEEVWVNYLSNAAKYGGHPPLITISAETLADGRIRYSVRDNGDGISEESQRLLFRRFERLGKRKVEGHGLGLALVKTILERLGGSVDIVSTGRPGEGSVFRFTLPGVG